jgi:hypothetical protein
MNPVRLHSQALFTALQGRPYDEGFWVRSAKATRDLLRLVN